MRKLLLTLIICCCTLAAAAENVVSASSASGHPQDEVTLQIALANTDAVVAFQTEIPLGDNLEYVANSVALNAERITDHGVTAAVVGGKLRIFAYSLSLIPFVGNEGTLLSFTLKLKNEPGDYAIDVSNSKLSDALGTSIAFNATNGSVTILSPKISVTTGTINYGHVPIRSDYSAAASVTNVGNEPLTITAINFSNAVFSCPSFVVTTVQPGNSANFTFKFAPMVKGVVNASATIVSNSISGNAIINLVADPFAVNEFHFTNVSGYCDSIVAVPMTVNNMENLIGFQIDVKLPSALEYVGFELSNRKTDHIAVGVVKNDTLRFIAYSPSSSAFTGDDGVIGTLRVRLHGLYGYYYLNPFKAVLADALGENVLSQKYEGYVNIRSPQISGNSTLSMGSSPVTETVTKEYTVNNYGNAQMRIDNVVFDQPDWSVAEMFPLTVEQYSNTVLHVSYSREQKGDFSAMMKIYSNDPQNGLKNVALSGTRYEPNSLSIEADPFTLDDNDVAVAIAMDNYSNIVALQADFEYPYHEYSVANADFHLTERFNNHSLYAMPVNDSVYKVLVFSLQNGAVNGNDGVVLNVTLHPIGNPEDKEYTVALKNIVLSAADGSNIFTGDNIADTYTLSVTHASAMAQGWNWWSTYIELDNVNGLEMLENSLGSNGLYIKTQTLAVQNYYASLNYNYWYGTLSSVGIQNEHSYMINVSSDCNISMTGRPCKPINHPITLEPEWNWIGYPVNVQQSVDDAMSNFTPSANDIVKGQNVASTYYQGYGWFPVLTMTPGVGYYYKSNAIENKTLTYAVNPTDNLPEVDDKHFWQGNCHAFANNIVVIAMLSVDCQEVRTDNVELGAFVDGECRGSAKLEYFEPLNRYFAVMTVSGENGEQIDFGFVDLKSETTNFSCNNHIIFESDAVVGTLDDSYVIDFNTGGESFSDLNLFPNPVEKNTSINIDIPTFETISEVVITNVLGSSLRHIYGAANIIDGISTAGIYNIQIITKSGNVYYGKLIVR